MKQSLRCHPASPCAPDQTVEVDARLGEGGLAVSYRLYGDAAQIRIPERTSASAADGLWRHTCLEAFVAAVDRPEYREFNFSPSGQWAVYRFTACRQRDFRFVPPAAPQIAFRRCADGFRLDAVIAPELLPAGALLNIGLTAGPPARRPRPAPPAGRQARRPARPPGFGHRRPHHSLDALAAARHQADRRLRPAARPARRQAGQHGRVAGLRRPVHGIPVFSLYGEVRRPTAAMLDSFDVLLVDLQDLGCRIYTFITTLRYVLEAAARHGKSVWVLDRPNPAGRPVEGLTLRDGWESFVGAGPMPMRHGLTMGELAAGSSPLWLDVDYRVIAMEGWQPDAAPGFGWPLGERTWINPSPNAPNLSMARCYAGTVMLEGTTLSEGRGTTRPLELFGAPDLDARR
jgi:hypothetical protein